MPPINKAKRPPNGYIMFCKFINDYMKIKYRGLNPQKMVRKKGEIWRNLPVGLRASFIMYATNYRKLLYNRPLDKPDGLNVIYDDNMFNPTLEDLEYKKLFEQLINYI